MKFIRNGEVFLLGAATWIFANSLLPVQAQYQPAQASVRAVQGNATCSVNGDWQPLKENATLATGAVIKTAPDATLDLFLPDSRTVLRLMPGSSLRFDRLDKMPAGVIGCTITKISLLSGALIGSQHKLVSPSEFEVSLPNAVAKIVGTVYSVKADGTVACLKGTVSVDYQQPGKDLPVNVSVPAGFTSNPATDKTAAISSDYLKKIDADLQAVRKNDVAFNDHRPITIVHNDCNDDVSPTRGHYDDNHNNGFGHDQGNDHDNKGGFGDKNDRW